jgi:hypothetical protein
MFTKDEEGSGFDGLCIVFTPFAAPLNTNTFDAAKHGLFNCSALLSVVVKLAERAEV